MIHDKLKGTERAKEGTKVAIGIPQPISRKVKRALVYQRFCLRCRRFRSLLTHRNRDKRRDALGSLEFFDNHGLITCLSPHPHKNQA